MSFAGQAPTVAPDFDAVARSLGVDGDRDRELREAQRLVAQNPRSAVAQLLLGDAHRHRGETDRAIAIYRRCATVDAPEVAVPARYFLAALGDAEMPAAAPDLYVANLFDKYADDFERELVKGLKYQGPIALHQAVCAVLGEDATPRDIMDAGCGTGLCGQMFNAMARRLDGIDLSEKMLAQAREKRIYDRLICGELCGALRGLPGEYDLVLAGDVLVYLGEPAAVMEAAKVALRPGGLFAFTTERGPAGCRLMANGRYQHGDEHIEAAALAAGYRVVRRDGFTVRYEEGRPLDGTVFVLARG